MKLPNVLNPLHREGQHNAAASSDNVEPRGDNGFGAVYVLRFPLATTKGAATVLSAWIIRHGEDFPRLTTCYIV
jgi:hypothetical protein